MQEERERLVCPHSHIRDIEGHHPFANVHKVIIDFRYVNMFFFCFTAGCYMLTERIIIIDKKSLKTGNLSFTALYSLGTCTFPFFVIGVRKQEQRGLSFTD